MKQLFRFFLIGIFAVIALAGQARAETLSSDDATKFVKALSDVEVFSNRLHEEGKDKILNDALQPAPGDKSYAPYLKGTEIMKDKLPSDYKNLGEIVSKHGFKSQEEWAKAGDSVMLAYMAIKIDAENPGALKQLQDIPAETKAKMDPATKAQLQQSINMMEIFTSAPQKNRDAVKPHVKEINAWLERSKAEKKPPAADKKKSAE
ncbi:MAG: hypothetical protein WBK55_04235 [Alphaproteobacteria bacterium]